MIDPQDPQQPLAPRNGLTPHPVRPVGVVLSAIALGLAAAVLLFLSLGGLVAVLGGSHLSAAAAPGVPSGGMLTGLMLGVTLVYLGLAAWAVVTLVGMIRMRSWARISAMVIAGCLVCFSLLGAVGTLGAQAMLKSGNVPLPPNVTPAMLHSIFVGMAGVSIVIALLGIVWLVYLAHRSTRDAFALARLAQNPAQLPSAAGYPTGVAPPAPAWPTRQAATAPAPNPLTDFTVARPLAPPVPTEPRDPTQQP